MAKKPATGTAIVNWEDEMAAQAKLAAAAQRKTGGGGGNFFSLAGGILKFDGSALPGNQMAVVVLADTMENVYYDSAYNSEVASSPKCFAFGSNEDEMEPHEAVDNDDCFERQADTCQECPLNEYGSSPTGKGKACSNVMRLALIPAGVYAAKGKGREVSYSLEKMFEDPAHFKGAEIAYLRVPVTSVKNYSNYVREVVNTMRRPPFGVFTNIWVDKHEKFQLSVNFEAISEVPTSLLPVIAPRALTAKAGIGFPYSPPADKAPPPPANAKIVRKPVPVRVSRGAKR